MRSATMIVMKDVRIPRPNTAGATAAVAKLQGIVGKATQKKLADSRLNVKIRGEPDEEHLVCPFVFSLRKGCGFDSA